MRNTLLGGVLAIVLIAVLFAASYHFRKPAEGPAQQQADARPPGEISKTLGHDFVGERRLGAWKLVCNEPRVFPRSPTSGMGNSEGTAPREEGPPPGWKLPRCFAGLVLRNPRNPKDEIRVTFRHFGFKRVLTLFLRFPPDEIDNSTAITVRFDGTQWPAAVRSCASQFCLSTLQVRRAEESVVRNAKSFSFAFKPMSSDTQIVLPVPVDGMTAAVDAMRRLND